MHVIWMWMLSASFRVSVITAEVMVIKLTNARRRKQMKQRAKVVAKEPARAATVVAPATVAARATGTIPAAAKEDGITTTITAAATEAIRTTTAMTKEVKEIPKEVTKESTTTAAKEVKIQVKEV